MHDLFLLHAAGIHLLCQNNCRECQPTLGKEHFKGELYERGEFWLSINASFQALIGQIKTTWRGSFCTYWQVYQTLRFWSGFPGWPPQTAVQWQSCKWDPAGSLVRKSPQWSDRTQLRHCETHSPGSRNPGKMKHTRELGREERKHQWEEFF